MISEFIFPVLHDDYSFNLAFAIQEGANEAEAMIDQHLYRRNYLP
jgi:hypothetical protein